MSWKVFPKWIKDKDLEFREDQLWYSLGSNELTGVASFSSEWKSRSRTKIREGLAYGLIQEWDENGTVDGPRFKGEFVPRGGRLFFFSDFLFHESLSSETVLPMNCKDTSRSSGFARPS